MKNILKKIAFVAVCSLAFTTNIVAQDAGSEKSTTEKNNSMDSFTEAQKAQFKANMAQRQAAQKQFRATFNAEQKAIMMDKAMSREQKMQKLELTLTPEQKMLWQKNKDEAKKNNMAFKQSLNMEQKKMLKQKTEHWAEKRKFKKQDVKIDSLD
jgi:hypothetical protein